MAHENDRFGAEIVWKRVELSEISRKRSDRESSWPTGRIFAGKGDLSINNTAMLGTDPFTFTIGAVNMLLISIFREDLEGAKLPLLRQAAARCIPSSKYAQYRTNLRIVLA
jgi:hypothetical protein